MVSPDHAVQCAFWRPRERDPLFARQRQKLIQPVTAFRDPQFMHGAFARFYNFEDGAATVDKFILAPLSPLGWERARGGGVAMFHHFPPSSPPSPTLWGEKVILTTSFRK